MSIWTNIDSNGKSMFGEREQKLAIFLMCLCEGETVGRKQDLVCATHVWRFQCVFPKELSIIIAASTWKVQKIVAKKEAERVINPVYNSIQMSGWPRNHPCRTQTASSRAKSKWTELWSCVLVKSLLKTLELYRKIQSLQFSSHGVGNIFKDGSEHGEHGIYNPLLKTISKDWPTYDSDVGTISDLIILNCPWQDKHMHTLQTEWK